MSDRLYLFATVAGTAIAVPTEEIEAVVRLNEIMPVFRVPCHVRGLAALRSRVLTVVDIRARTSGEALPMPPRPLAIVAEIDGHNFALLIEEVEDVCPIAQPVEPVMGRISDDWAPFARGMILDNAGRMHLVISLADITRCGVTATAA